MYLHLYIYIINSSVTLSGRPGGYPEDDFREKKKSHDKHVNDVM